MTLGPRDLVLCSGTLPRHTSFRERLAAASAAGYTAVSMWGRDYERARRDGHDDHEMRTMLDDHGLCVAEVDPAWWWTPGADAVVIAPELDPFDVFCHGADDLFGMAERLGARSLNAADVLGGRWTLAEAAEAFAALCDRAAEHGLLVHLEWLAWSRIPDLDSAWEVVRAAGRHNGGLNIDVWHCGRTGTTPDDLRALPGDRVLAIQLDDAPAAPEADLLEATLHERLLPGEGDLEVVGYLEAMRDMGVRAPVGVEVFSDSLHDRGATTAAAESARATRMVLAAARWATT